MTKGSSPQGGGGLSLSKADIQALKDNCDLREWVGRKVKLSGAGEKRKGLCPFHSEKTPSFEVTRQRFQCFGCNASGDIFEWLKGAENLSFWDAAKLLGAPERMPRTIQAYAPPMLEELEPLSFEDRVARCRALCPLHWLIHSLLVLKAGPQLLSLVEISVKEKKAHDEIAFICSYYRLDPTTLMGRYEALTIWESFCTEE